MKKTTALLLALCLVGVASTASAGAATISTDAGDDVDLHLAPQCTGPPETQPLCQAVCPVVEKVTGQPCA